MRINRIAMVLLFLMGIYILAASGTVLCANLVEMAPDQVLETMKDCLVKEAAANIYPGMFIPEEKEQEGTFSKWYAEMVLRMHPLMRLQAGIRENGGSENLATYEMLIQGGVHDENELDESGQEYDLASLAEQEMRQHPGSRQKRQSRRSRNRRSRNRRKIVWYRKNSQLLIWEPFIIWRNCRIMNICSVISIRWNRQQR